MGVPRHHLFKRVIQRCSKVNMNILKINTAYLIKYYMDIDEKFPGKSYHLDDDPNVSQKYLGYGFRTFSFSQNFR